MENIHEMWIFGENFKLPKKLSTFHSGEQSLLAHSLFPITIVPLIKQARSHEWFWLVVTRQISRRLFSQTAVKFWNFNSNSRKWEPARASNRQHFSVAFLYLFMNFQRFKYLNNFQFFSFICSAAHLSLLCVVWRSTHPSSPAWWRLLSSRLLRHHHHPPLLLLLFSVPMKWNGKSIEEGEGGDGGEWEMEKFTIKCASSFYLSISVLSTKYFSIKKP